MNQKTIDVFLSHSSRDKKLVSKIADDIAKSGIRPWLDDTELRRFGGSNIFDIIRDSIQNGKYPCMLLFISSSSSKSNWVDREIGWLLDSKKNFRIIPIMLDKYEDLELSTNMKLLLENMEGERIAYYLDYTKENYENLLCSITLSICNHYKLGEEEEIVIHAGHRLSWNRREVPDIWQNRRVLDFRTKIGDGDSYYVPSNKELFDIEKGIDRARLALTKIKRIYFCGSTYLSFAALLSKTWGRGSGIELSCWNMMDSNALGSSLNILTDKPEKYMFEIIRKNGEDQEKTCLTIFLGWQENIASQAIEEFQDQTSFLWLKTNDIWKDDLNSFVSQVIFFITKIAINYNEINLIFSLPLALVAVVTWNLRAIRKISLYEYKRKGRKKYTKTVQLM